MENYDLFVKTLNELKPTDEVDKKHFDFFNDLIKHLVPCEIVKMRIVYCVRDYNELYLINREGVEKWFHPRYLRNNIKMYFC